MPSDDEYEDLPVGQQSVPVTPRSSVRNRSVRHTQSSTSDGNASTRPKRANRLNKAPAAKTSPSSPKGPSSKRTAVLSTTSENFTGSNPNTSSALQDEREGVAKSTNRLRTVKHSPKYCPKFSHVSSPKVKSRLKLKRTSRQQSLSKMLSPPRAIVKTPEKYSPPDSTLDPRPYGAAASHTFQRQVEAAGLTLQKKPRCTPSILALEANNTLPDLDGPYPMYGAGYGGATRNIPASQTKTAAVATNGQCSLSPIPLVPGGQLGDGGGYNTCNSDKSDSNTAWLTQKHQPSATRTTASPEVWRRQAAFYVGSSPNTSGDTELYLDSPQA